MNSRTRRQRIGSLLFLILFTLALASVAQAQQKERTLDEIANACHMRPGPGMYPLIGLDPADVREAFASIKTTDIRATHAAFHAAPVPYLAEAISLEQSDPAK